MTERRQKIYTAIISVLALAIVITMIWAVTGGKDDPQQNDQIIDTENADRKTEVREVQKAIIVEKEFTSDIIRDELRDMGILITQDYFFTEVMSYSSMKNFLGIELPVTESSYIASYDGDIKAGIDCTKISVEKNTENKTVTIYLPSSEIQSFSIDTDSFTVYQEKNGVGNKVSISDFNLSLSELEKNAKEKAVKKGLLEEADKNARLLIRNFVSAFVDKDYNIIFK